MAKSKKETISNVYDHSQAKLNFYRSYLTKYFSVSGHSGHFNRINIFDVFCGEGIYQDKNEGSPIIARKIIANNLEKFPEQKISLTVNDKEKWKIEQVVQYIQNEFFDRCEFEYYNLDAVDMFNLVIKKLNSTQKNEKNLIFIDPY